MEKRNCTFTRTIFHERRLIHEKVQIFYPGACRGGSDDAGGCKDKEKYDESAFQDDLEPLSEDEVEAMDQNGDDEMAVADESDLEQLQDSENAAGSGDTDGSASSDAADSQSEKKLDENGTYTDKDEVAQYIYEYGHVPPI